MPIQRKVFRVEQMGSTETSSESAADANRQTFKIEANGLRQLQHEAEAIHNAIARTKHEIAMLHAGHGRPRAARELHAVVDGPARAAHQLMTADETISTDTKAP